MIEYEFLDENLYFDRYGGVQTEWEGKVKSLKSSHIWHKIRMEQS
ncbi:MAG: hypothetical protein ACR2IS_01045 [Nitrososphaeraceae archaeon]